MRTKKNALAIFFANDKNYGTIINTFSVTFGKSNKNN
jgi:hypothetical protein